MSTGQQTAFCCSTRQKPDSNEKHQKPKNPHLESLTLLPIDLAFLRGVDLGEFDPFVVKEDLHVIEQKLVRIRVRDVDAKVVDELVLFLQPLFPATLTHLGTDLLSKLRGQRSVTDRFRLLTTTPAFEFVTTKYCHIGILPQPD